MNKIKIINTKIILINNIRNPPNSPRKYTPTIIDSGAKIHLENKTTQTMPPVIMSKDMTERLPDGSTMDSSHVEKLQLPGLTKKTIQILILPETITAPLISLGVPYVIMDTQS